MPGDAVRGTSILNGPLLDTAPLLSSSLLYSTQLHSMLAHKMQTPFCDGHHCGVGSCHTPLSQVISLQIEHLTCPSSDLYFIAYCCLWLRQRPLRQIAVADLKYLRRLVCIHFMVANLPHQSISIIELNLKCCRIIHEFLLFKVVILVRQSCLIAGLISKLTYFSIETDQRSKKSYWWSIPVTSNDQWSSRQQRPTCFHWWK